MTLDEGKRNATDAGTGALLVLFGLPQRAPQAAEKPRLANIFPKFCIVISYPDCFLVSQHSRAAWASFGYEAIERDAHLQAVATLFTGLTRQVLRAVVELFAYAAGVETKYSKTLEL